MQSITDISHRSQLRPNRAILLLLYPLLETQGHLPTGCDISGHPSHTQSVPKQASEPPPPQANTQSAELPPPSGTELGLGRISSRAAFLLSMARKTPGPRVLREGIS